MSKASNHFPPEGLSLEALQSLIFQIPSAMAILDVDMRYIAVSQRWIQDYRLERGSVVGKSHYEVFPDLPPEWRTRHQSVLSGTPDTCEQYLFTHRDGSKDWIRWEAKPWKDPQGLISGLILVTEIINQSIYAQDALRASEEKYSKVFLHSADAILLHDFGGRIIDANPKAREMLDYSLSELRGMAIQDLHPPETISTSKHAFETIKEKKWVKFDIDFLRKNGPPFPAEVSASLYEVSGEVLIQGIFRDLTERKKRETEEKLQVEQELAAVDRRYNQLVESLPIAVLVIDLDGRISFVNEFAANIVKVPRERIIGERFDSEHWGIRDLDGSPLDPATRPFTRVMQEQEPYLGHEFRMKRSDGASIILSSYLAPLKDEKGELDAVLITGMEITEHRNTQDALKESEERLRQVTESIREVFWMTDPLRKKFLYISPAYEEIWGRSCDSAYKEPSSFLDAIHEDDRDRVIRNISKQTRGNYDELYRVVRPDASIRWIRDKAFPIYDKDGEVYRVAGIAEDVTALKLASEELEETNAFLDSVFENIPNMIFVKDAKNLRFVRFNKAGEKLIGRPREELIGKNDFDLFAPEEAEFFTQNDREVIENGKLIDVPKESIHTPEGLRYLHTKKIPILDKHLIPRFLLGISEDITERIQIEQDLRLLASITERSVDAIMTIDNEKRFMFWNEAAERIFGFTYDEVKGKHIFDIFVPQEHQDEVARSLNVHPRNPEAIRRIRSERLHKKGHPIPVMITSFPISNENDDVLAWVAITQDLTQIVAMEQKMASQARMAAIGQMAAGIAHEIRNPLFGISSATQILGAHCQEIKELKELSSASLVEIARLKKLVDELLLFSKPSSLEKTEIFPEKLYESILQLHSPLLDQKRIRIEAKFEPESSSIFADEEKIKQVLLNLFLNAIQASNRGDRIHVHSQIEKEGAWRFEIFNPGEWIPKKLLKRVFEPFVSTKKEGSGLGLAVCRKVIEEHGGTLKCTSSAEDGTTFTFHIPSDVALTTPSKPVKDRVTK